MAGIVMAVAASNVVAQESNSPFLAFGVAGGLARAGGLSGGSGYHVLGTFDVRTPLRALRVRTDGMFADWGGSGEGRVSALSSGLVFSPFSTSKVAPYATAGVGGYYTGGVGVRPGWTLGLGVRSRYGIFLESKLHTIQQRGTHLINYGDRDTDKKWKAVWIPVSLGVTF